MSILWDKTFQWVPTILTLWPWSLTYFFKNVKLANNFWTVRYRTLIFYLGTNNCDIDLGLWPTFWNFNFVHNIWIVTAKALIFHISIFSIRTFSWVPTFLTLWPWSWSLAYVLNTLTLLIKLVKWVLELCFSVFLCFTLFNDYRNSSILLYEVYKERMMEGWRKLVAKYLIHDKWRRVCGEDVLS